ncbi:hypothetical protein GEV33_001921 [Tenebrio molitor]|uniref:Uncharacterized protein n=1 Tax=Tenebrio molitor TaxID=7067 RepID=A0A8J6HLC5_TENMO|nr:hypothetical protein GEV33_001921 [Tenebrio molitor]
MIELAKQRCQTLVGHSTDHFLNTSDVQQKKNPGPASAAKKPTFSEEIATLCPSLSIVKAWRIVSRKTNRPTSFIRVLTTDKWTVDHMLINGIDLYGRTFVCERCVERMECSNPDRVKWHTLEIEKELGMIAKAIKNEQEGKISFTKEEQKRILEASGTIRASVTQLGESGEARGGGGDAEEATQAGGREGKRDEAPRRHEDKGDSDGRDAGKEGATLSESSTERGARDSENRNEQTDRAKRGREKKGGATEGIESASGKLEDGFIRFKLKAKIPVKEETTVKIQGKTAEEVKAKLVRTLDIERIGGPLSQMIPTKRGEVVLVSRSEEQRKMLETVLITTEGIEIGSRRKLNPVVTLTGLETGWKEEEIVEEVFQKNDWIRNTGTMEEFKRAFKFLARKRCQKSPKENLTFAVESRLHKALIERQKIGVRLTIVFVEEMVQLPAETEVPQMRQGGSQDQRMQSREIRMRELQADRAQSLL